MSQSDSSRKRTNADELPNDVHMKTARKDNQSKLRLQFLNLPPECNWQMLKDIVKTHSGCEDCFVEIVYGYDGKHTGTGIVALKTPEQVEQTINSLNNYQLNGNQISVIKDTKENKLNKMQACNDPNTSILLELGVEPGPISSQVFVANVDYESTVPELEQLFRLAGGVQHVEKIDSVSKGCYLIRFDHPLEAIQAISMFNRKKYNGRYLTVKMDRVKSTSKKQLVLNALPTGLQSIGLGLGVSGKPLLNVGQYANGLALRNLPVFGGDCANFNENNMAMPMYMNSAKDQSFNMNMPGNPNYNMMQQANMQGNKQIDLSSIVQETVKAITSQFLVGQFSNPMEIDNSYQSFNHNNGYNNNNGFNNGFNNNMGPSNYIGPNNNMGPLNNFGPNNNMGPYNNMGPSTNGGPIMPRNIKMENNQASMFSPNFNDSNQNCTVTVSNLPKSYNWQALKDKCKEIGEVKFVEVTKVSGKNVGMALFKSDTMATKAANALNGIVLDGFTIQSWVGKK